MPRFIVLFENATGLSLFDCKGLNEVVVSEPQYQKQFIQFNLFHKLVQLETFQPFPSSEIALDTLQQLTEGSLSQFFRTFLTTAFAAEDAKYQGITLGVSDSKLAGSIASELGYPCIADSNTREIIRGIRMHFTNFMDDIKKDDVRLAELGLAHGYSRAKVKFNQHGDDNMIISSIVLLTTLDKDLNTFAMRLREWYSVYFPELSALIPDHATYAAAVQAVGFRDKLDKDALLNVLKDADLVDKIKYDADNSIGREIDETDRVRIISMAERVEGLAQYRETLQGYLRERMHDIAPNLTALVGERTGAQLIAASGSLTNLAKAPASTVQLLGAEKALFNALKKRKPTPKYGLIYNSAPVGAADQPNKGRTARSLANKISIAARMDAFGDDFRGGHLGALMKDMLQIRSEKIKQNKRPTPNFDAMVEAVKKARKLEAVDPANAGATSEVIIHSHPLTEADAEKDFVYDGKGEVKKPAAESKAAAGEETPRRHRRKHRSHSTEPAEESAPQQEEKPAEEAQPAAEGESSGRRRKHRRSSEAQPEAAAEQTKEETVSEEKPQESAEQPQEGHRKRRHHRKQE